MLWGGEEGGGVAGQTVNGADNVWQLGRVFHHKRQILSLFPLETANDINLTLLIHISQPAHIDGLSGPSKNLDSVNNLLINLKTETRWILKVSPTKKSQSVPL